MFGIDFDWRKIKSRWKKLENGLSSGNFTSNEKAKSNLEKIKSELWALVGQYYTVWERKKSKYPEHSLDALLELLNELQVAFGEETSLDSLAQQTEIEKLAKVMLQVSEEKQKPGKKQPAQEMQLQPAT